MRYWIRRVVPTSGLLLGAVVIYLTMTFAPYAVFRMTTRGEVNPPDDIFQVGLLTLILMTIGYAGYRILVFHPLFHKEYRNWLLNSPWTPEKPLPVGPPELVLQDAVIVGAITGLSLLHLDSHPLMVPSLFVVVHTLFCTFSLLLTRQWLHAYALVFVLSGLMYFRNSAFLLSGVLLLLVAITFHGIRRSLRTFRNWDLEWFEKIPILQTNSERAKEAQRESLLGWPYDRLAPKRNEWRVSFGWSLALSFLIGWWTFSPIYLFPVNADDVEILFVTMNPYIFGLVAVRCYIYLVGYAPPLTFWGRIFSGCLIIPGYDIVFAAPIAVLMLSGLVVYAIEHLGYPVSICLGLMTSLSLFITLSSRPSLDEWKLTANHRIVPGVALQKQELQQTQ